MTEPQSLVLPTLAQEAEIKKASDGIAMISKTLKNNERVLAAVLGKFMAPERFAATVLTVCQQTPDLQICKPSSILLTAIRIARLNLSPDPALGQAFFIPRKGKDGAWRAEFQLGYKGDLALCYRSPLTKAVRYGVVRTGEHFVWEDGRNWRLEHIQGEDGWPANQGETVAAWAILELVNGGAIPRVMYTAEILRHKARGAGKQIAWVNDFASQSVKTVLGDVCYRGPFEAEIGRAFALDLRGDMGLGQEVGDDAIDVEPVDSAAAITEPKSNGGALDTFKQAFGAPETAAATNEESDDDPLGGALDDPAPDKPSVMPSAAVARILRAAASKGLAEADIDRLANGKLREAPASAEMEILRSIEAYRTAGKK